MGGRRAVAWQEGPAEIWTIEGYRVGCWSHLSRTTKSTEDIKTQCRGDKWQDVGQGSSSLLVTFIFPLFTVQIIIIIIIKTVEILFTYHKGYP